MVMDRLLSIFNAGKKRRFVKFGIPFLALVLGGSFYLEQFSKLKYQFGPQKSLVDPAALKKEGIAVRDRSEITLEAEYEKMKQLDIDNWKQIRGPRPWEENTSSN